MKFDAYAVLDKLRLEGGTRAVRATCATQPAPDSTNSTNSTDRPVDTARSEAVPCSTNSTNSTGQAVAAEDSEAGGYLSCQHDKTDTVSDLPLPLHIAAAVSEAFKDYWATDDPFGPEAWI
jgi:hypothetical protein